MHHGLDPLDDHPLAWLAALVLAATVGYVAVSALLGALQLAGTVGLIDVAAFAALFAAVYVTASWYVSEYQRRESAETTGRRRD